MMEHPGSKSLAIHPPLQCGVWLSVFRRRRGAAERDGSRSLLQLVCTRRRFAVTAWREMQMEGEEVIFYWRSRLTNSHYADVLHRLRSLQSIQPRNQHKGFFFYFMECPRLLVTNRGKCQKLIEKRWEKNGSPTLVSSLEDRSRIICSDRFAVRGVVYVAWAPS